MASQGKPVNEVNKEVEILLQEDEGVAAGVAPSEEVGIIETPPCESLLL